MRNHVQCTGSILTLGVVVDVKLVVLVLARQDLIGQRVISCVGWCPKGLGHLGLKMMKTCKKQRKISGENTSRTHNIALLWLHNTAILKQMACLHLQPNAFCPNRCAGSNLS
jgi:hypothetical protein